MLVRSAAYIFLSKVNVFTLTEWLSEIAALTVKLDAFNVSILSIICEKNPFTIYLCFGT